MPHTRKHGGQRNAEQKRIDSYVRPRKTKKELDKWIIEDVNHGYKSIPNPEDDEEHPFVFEDCAEITLRNRNTNDIVKMKDDFGMIEFWEAQIGFTFKWRGGKRIKRMTVWKALSDKGILLIEEVI